MSEPKEVAEQEMNKVFSINGDDVTDTSKKSSAVESNIIKTNGKSSVISDKNIELEVAKTKDEISVESNASEDIVDDDEVVDELDEDRISVESNASEDIVDDDEVVDELDEDRISVESNASKDIVDDDEVVDELDEDSRATKLLVEGNKFLFANDYGSAVNCFSKCCKILASIYGELGSKCGESFYLYGLACLELGKQENQKAAQKEMVNEAAEIISISSDETDEDRKIENAVDEKVDVVTAERDVEVQVADDVGQSNDVEGERVVLSAAIVEGVVSDEDANQEANETDEEMENFQLAWEVLEIAKKIFERDEDLKRMADVYLKLGEVSILSGNYSTAIEDLTMAMDLANGHPLISEEVVLDIYYQLAVANKCAHQYDEAIKYGELAQKFVEGKLSRIVGNLEKETELLELQAFLKAAEDILIDTRALKEATLAKQSVSMGASFSNSGSGTSSSSTKTSLTADDISHLVRRKDAVKRKRESDSD